MKRRTFAAGASGVLAGLAGCLADTSGTDDTPSDESTTSSTETTTASSSTTATSPDLPADVDGYPDSVDAKPEDRRIETSDLDTVEENGVEVPLLPVEDAYVWWAYRRARFADARGPEQYENSHIVGSVLSPAPEDMRDSSDPVLKWGKRDRIVCYCGCPHHLSSIRASYLIENGYENVYVIDEGFFEWRDLDYPVTGGDGDIREFVVEGRVDARYAGENAWVRPVDSEQLESTNVQADGSFALHCKFVDVTADTRLTVSTPAWTKTGTVRALTDGILTRG